MRLLPSITLLAMALPDSAEAARPIVFAEQMGAETAIVLPLANAEELELRGAAIDPASRAAIARALSGADFRYRAGSHLTLRGIGRWNQIVIVGAGGDGPEAVRQQDIGGIAARETASENGPVALIAGGPSGNEASAVQLGIGARLGSYRFDRYQSEDPERPRHPGRDAPLTIVTPRAGEAKARWTNQGQTLSDAVYFTRDLIAEPANILNPESFVSRTREAFEGVRGITIQALDVAEMERLGMNAILSVGQGSAKPPRMLIVEYRGRGAEGPPILLAGKGITFDSGGTSIKPGANMWRMKGDMAGAAAVVGTVLSLARSEAPVHVVAVAALAENMPSGSAARPGDVVRAYNGRTIERVNTDAEGRIVLADAVAYAERRFQPAAIIDVATLTGAIVTALGSDYSGLFSRNEALAEQLIQAGTRTGEPLWRMPLHQRYAEAMKSPVADIRDTSESAPGAGAGAHFIGTFVTPQTPWAHLDIAGTSMPSEAKPTVPVGPAGVTVRLLDQFVRGFRPVAGAR